MRRRRLSSWEQLARWSEGARSILASREVRIEFPAHIYYADQGEWIAIVRGYGGRL